MLVDFIDKQMLKLFGPIICLVASVAATNKYNLVAEQSRKQFPQVIGHAGASGYVPESSLIGYDLAANLLADYSEPDLVLTKDKVFIASHDLTLEGTTNVADLFPESRMETFVIEGVAIKGYYAINFTLSEIKALRIRQRFEGRSTLYNWLYTMPTLEEIIDWQITHFNTSGRLVGIYPELKHPDFYNEMGYPMEDLFLDVIKSAGYHYEIGDELTPRNVQDIVPLAIQCFKPPSLKYLATRTNIPLVQLLGTSSSFPTPLLVWNEVTLDEIKRYAQVASADKNMFTMKMNTTLAMALEMVSWARNRGLYFVPWSFQLEDKYIAPQFEGDSTKELGYFYGCLGAAGLFHEFPDHAREVLTHCDGSDCRRLCQTN